MPTNNETIIAVPLGVTNPEELRTFLVKLIVSLDILVGLRGGETPLVTKTYLEEQLATAVEVLPTYEQTISTPFDQAEMQTMSDAVTALTDKVNEMINE